MLLAIGGQETLNPDSNTTSNIYMFVHEQNKWLHIGNLPLPCTYVDTVLLPSEELLVVDGYNRKVFKGTIVGEPC